jgi:uncharacterized protein (TIGR00255 family)
MIYSMTGYGKQEGQINGKQISIEIKSLNGKQFDIINRLNPLIKTYELDIRNILLQLIKRGSVEVLFTIKQEGVAKPVQINRELVKYFFNTMQEINKELSDTALDATTLLAQILRMPEIVASDTEGLSEEEWHYTHNLLKQAAWQLMERRAIEGEGLEKEMHLRVNNIESLLKAVQPFEEERMQRIKQKIYSSLEETANNITIDNNRLEQEMIYYIEKLDIAEEKQRLNAHIAYFRSIMETANEEGVGKKIGFLLQEFGREINTLGSKANHAALQKIVVNMKDELEKAKEQALNIL